MLLRRSLQAAKLLSAVLAACGGFSASAQATQATAEAATSRPTTAPALGAASNCPSQEEGVEKPLRSILDGWAWWNPAPLTEPIETDRPDFTESTSAVPRAHAQLEGGYTFTYDREKRTRTRSHTAPELLFRAGLLDDFELRVGWEGYAWMDDQHPGETRVGRPITIDDWSQGGADQYLGFKWKLLDQEGPRPDFAIIPAITVPTGGGGFSSGDVDPEIKLAWGYDLTDRLGLAGNVNLGAPTDNRERFLQTAASASLSYALLDNVGAYFEYYGFYPNSRGSDCAHALNTGLTWRITPNLQLDWRIGGGLNEEADDFFTGIGFAVRF